MTERLLPSLRIAVGVVALTALLAPAPSAQEYGRLDDIQAEVPGFYAFARPGQAIVAVTTVGAVPAPGRYFLGVGTTLADLLALSGGVPAAPGAAPTVRVYRGGVAVVESPVPDLYATAAAPVVLVDGDVIEVEGLVSTVPGYLVHARQGTASVAVTAAGALTPGRYVLEAGATVGDLVAFAGGSPLGMRDARTRVTATVRLYRAGGVAFESALADLYAQPSPALETGDVVELDVVTRQAPTRFTWRDALSIVTTSMAIVLAVERLTN